MGTTAGAVQLLNALWALRNHAGAFPCCPLLHSDGSLASDRCAADDQICLQSALRLSRAGELRPPSAELDYRVDRNATLFATLSASQDLGMVRFWTTSDGVRHMGYRANNDPSKMTEPCVAHLAGVGKLGLRRILIDDDMASAAWLPWAVNYARGFVKRTDRSNRTSWIQIKGGAT
jgi:hypothetical protein